jgi:hypothetical protein
VKFDSGSWENGHYIEPDKWSNVATAEGWVNLAGVISGKKWESSHSVPSEQDAGKVPGTVMPGDETTGDWAGDWDSGWKTVVMYD